MPKCVNTKEYREKKHSLSEIYIKYRPEYLKDKDRELAIKDRHLEAMRKSEVCRSLKLGAILIGCEQCGDQRFLFHTCKHRFCSNCGSANTYQWAEKTLGKLMEIPHHHIVMTLPKKYRILSLSNENILHNLLFKISSKVIQHFFKYKYNCLPGIISVLHTSGSDLKYHPHVHMIVSRGGLNKDKNEYFTIKGTYLVKNEILGKLIKELYEIELIKLWQKGEINTYKAIEKDFPKWVNNSKLKHWIVNIEKPLKEVRDVVNYVGRYTKRACISEYKLEEISPNIKFKYKDYKNSIKGEKPLESIITMTPTQFLDKLLVHVPTKRYRMVRYSGIYNSYYSKQIPENKRANLDPSSEEESNYDWGELEQMRKHLIKNGHKDFMFCDKCQIEKIIIGVVFCSGEIKNYDDSS